jgi:hypothetical protein
MKLNEVIKRINKNKPDNNAIDDLAEELELDMVFNWTKWESRATTNLVSYWVECWYCTDDWVGTKLYFLDDEFIAYSSKSGRKNHRVIVWESNHAFDKTKSFIKSYCDDIIDDISLVNLDKDIGEGYSIGFSSQLLTQTTFHKKCIYKGTQYIVDVEAIKAKAKQSYISSEIVLKDGINELVVNIRDVVFPFNII